ncbi:peptidase [Ruminococcaceae bacterium OttesenSCG-928-O06]|nr:peptidase [Ruminococcaceae bacterium OttesenSCG-928-O06]
MNKKIPVSIALAITILAMTVTFSITWLLSMSTFDNTVSAVTNLQAQYTKLAEIDRYVRNNFYGSIDDDYLFDRVAAGYMNGLPDRYCTYYSEAEYTELLAIENGELLSSGIEVLREASGAFRIVRVYPDSPAERAGVEALGVITQVNGVDARTYTTVRALHSAMRGTTGTELSLTCLYGVSDEVNYTVRYQASYANPTVEYIKVGDYAFIRIYAFTAKTYAEFDFAVRAAQNDGVLGLLFDVRGNSGGLFRDAYEVIDLLAPLGTVAKSMNKAGVVSVLATSDEAAVDLPMVVLVNESTSAAAELFACSVRDLCGGQLVGQRTAGRGTLQNTSRLYDGSAVTVTVATLLTGRDESFNGTGLVPDVEVSNDGVPESVVYSPAPLSDPQALRALNDVLRTMVRERGEDPGSPITGQVASISGADSSGSDLSGNDVSGEDVSVSGGDDATDDDSDADADAGGTSTSQRG